MGCLEDNPVRVVEVAHCVSVYLGPTIGVIGAVAGLNQPRDRDFPFLGTQDRRLLAGYGIAPRIFNHLYLSATFR